jgi:hypothetical protein
MLRIATAHALWLVSDWLEDAREKLLDAAGKVAGI